jgi:hypothetical protein
LDGYTNTHEYRPKIAQQQNCTLKAQESDRVADKSRMRGGNQFIFCLSNYTVIKMKKPPQIRQGTANLRVRDLIAQRSMKAAGALLIFDREIPAPMFRPCESLAYRGCVNAFEVAAKFLNKPNALAYSVLAEMKSLDHECTKIYEENSLSDDYERDHRSLSNHQSWKALCALGRYEVEECQAERVAVGVNMGLAWVGQKKMAAGHIKRIVDSLEIMQLTLEDLKHLLTLSEEDRSKYTKLIPWFKQFEIFLEDFRQVFDEFPNARPPGKTFDQKVKGEMGFRVAFASAHHRAGILDDQCLTKRQLANVIKYQFAAPFTSSAARRVAIWLIEFSGLNTETVKDIPIVQGNPLELVDDWAIKYELQTGILLRDYSALAKDSAKPEGVEAEPAAYVFRLPAPASIHEDIKALLTDFPADDEPVTFGKLIPELESIQPQWTIYPSTDQFPPSWAKLSYTVGPLLVEGGMDSLLAGGLVGNLGIPIKSKAFYARVTPTEIWSAASHAYHAMGQSEPVEMPPNLLAFGARVVPSTRSLCDLDTGNLKKLEELRQILLYANNSSRLKVLLDLHNGYSLALGFRLMIRLSLRGAAEFPLRASLLASTQLTIDIREKASAGRRGGVAAIITEDMRNELVLYQKHCEALYARLAKMKFKGVAMQWLKDVIDGKDVSLLVAISESGSIKPLSTKQVVDSVGTSSKLANDFGRKWMENSLRATGYCDPLDSHSPAQPASGQDFQVKSPNSSNFARCRTEDIDQALRHEAAGRETTTAISDSCERSWAKRMAPAMDRATRQIFKQQLFGLRKK